MQPASFLPPYLMVFWKERFGARRYSTIQSNRIESNQCLASLSGSSVKASVGPGIPSLQSIRPGRCPCGLAEEQRRRLHAHSSRQRHMRTCTLFSFLYPGPGIRDGYDLLQYCTSPL